MHTIANPLTTHQCPEQIKGLHISNCIPNVPPLHGSPSSSSCTFSFSSCATTGLCTCFSCFFFLRSVFNLWQLARLPLQLRWPGSYTEAEEETHTGRGRVRRKTEGKKETQKEGSERLILIWEHLWRRKAGKEWGQHGQVWRIGGGGGEGLSGGNRRGGRLSAERRKRGKREGEKERKKSWLLTMKALLLLVLPWLSPANYTDNLGNLHILYSELWVQHSASTCILFTNITPSVPSINCPYSFNHVTVCYFQFHQPFVCVLLHYIFMWKLAMFTFW